MRSQTRIIAVIFVAAVLTVGHSALPSGQRAPDLAGKTNKGQPFNLRSLHGKVVVIDFWGPG